jgi:hypothetical protein
MLFMEDRDEGGRSPYTVGLKVLLNGLQEAKRPRSRLREDDGLPHA